MPPHHKCCCFLDEDPSMSIYQMGPVILKAWPMPDLIYGLCYLNSLDKIYLRLTNYIYIQLHSTSSPLRTIGHFDIQQPVCVIDRQEASMFNTPNDRLGTKSDTKFASNNSFSWKDLKWEICSQRREQVPKTSQALWLNPDKHRFLIEQLWINMLNRFSNLASALWWCAHIIIFNVHNWLLFMIADGIDSNRKL